jgi:hypothetical protein
MKIPMLLRPARAAQRSEAREVCRITPVCLTLALAGCATSRATSDMGSGSGVAASPMTYPYPTTFPTTFGWGQVLLRTLGLRTPG